jgi:hypothetical protein
MKNHSLEMMFIHPMSLSKSTIKTILQKTNFPEESLVYYIAYYYDIVHLLNWTDMQINKIQRDLKHADLFELNSGE